MTPEGHWYVPSAPSQLQFSHHPSCQNNLSLSVVFKSHVSFLQRMPRGRGKCWSREGEDRYPTGSQKPCFLLCLMSGCWEEISQSLGLLPFPHSFSEASFWSPGPWGEQVKTLKSALKHWSSYKMSKSQQSTESGRVFALFQGREEVKAGQCWGEGKKLGASYYTYNWLILTLLRGKSWKLI